MYGAKPELEVRGKKRIKSCYGAFISFLAGAFIFTYFAYKLLYFMQNIMLIRKFLELLTQMTGVELNEEVDLALEFANSPGKYEYSNWALVQTDTDLQSGGEIKTILYLQSVKKTSFYLRWSDACANVGGFVMFIYFLFWPMTKSVNERLMKKYLIEDTYTIKRNKEYLCIKDTVYPPSRKLSSAKKAKDSKKKKKQKAEPNPEPSEKDEGPEEEASENEGGSVEEILD